MRKTYLLGSQPIAQGSYSYSLAAGASANTQRPLTSGRSTVERLHLYTDHLGSANTTLNMATGEIKDTRFYPFGELRTGSTGEALDATGRGFTGHRENRDIGLTYMNARFYVPGAGRFASADTIVPDPVNPQAWNRYSYVFNNPVANIDINGHDPVRITIDPRSFGNALSDIRSAATVLNTRKEDRDNQRYITSTGGAFAGGGLAAISLTATATPEPTTTVAGITIALGAAIGYATDTILYGFNELVDAPERISLNFVEDWLTDNLTLPDSSSESENLGSLSVFVGYEIADDLKTYKKVYEEMQFDNMIVEIDSDNKSVKFIFYLDGIALREENFGNLNRRAIDEIQTSIQENN